MRFFNSAFSFSNCFIYASLSIEFLSDKNKLLLQSFKWSERLQIIILEERPAAKASRAIL
jgi:hypothetical protein